MKSLTTTPKTLGFGTDGDDLGGARLVPGAWQPPESATQEDADAARGWLKNFQTATDDRNFRPASDAMVEKWLGTVLGGSAMARNWTEADVMLKVRVLKIAIEDRDHRWFTKETIREAWKRFEKWIPSGADLIEFFDTLEANERMMAARMHKVIDIAAKGPKKRAVPEGEYYNPSQESDWGWSKAEAEAYTLKMRERKRRELSELAKIAREMPKAEGDDLVPIPQAGESEDAFLARCKVHRDGIEAKATPIMMGRGAGRSRLKPDEPVHLGNAVGKGPARPDIAERARREAARHDGKPADWAEPAPKVAPAQPQPAEATP